MNGKEEQNRKIDLVESHPSPIFEPTYLNKIEPDFFNISDLTPEHIGQTITVKGNIEDVRKQGGVSFIQVGGSNPDLSLQIVVLTPKGEKRELFASLGLQKGSIVSITGELKQREPQNIKAEDVVVNYFAQFELVVDPSEIQAQSHPEVPVQGLRWEDVVNGGLLRPELYGEILRMREFQRVIQLRHDLGSTFTSHFIQKGFQRIDVPALTTSVAESGAEVFMVKGKVGELALIQSPQQIKQVMAGIFGKVVWEGQAFRDDPSDTAHHLAEFTGLDIEMQLQHTDKWAAMSDVMIHLQDVIKLLVEEMRQHPQVFAENHSEIPTVPSNGIPVIMFNDALALTKSTNFNREAERKLGELVKESTGSSFCFVAGYPDVEKPFYTDVVGDGSTYSFDLIFNGVEIASGGLRIADPKLLRQRLEQKGYDAKPFETYLDNFGRGTVATGGFGLGLERLVARALGGINVRLTTIYPKTAKAALG